MNVGVFSFCFQKIFPHLERTQVFLYLFIYLLFNYYLIIYLLHLLFIHLLFIYFVFIYLFIYLLLNVYYLTFSLDEIYVIHTHGQADFKAAGWTLAKDYVTLLIMACEDAQVLLNEIPGDTASSGYKVIFGADNNQKTTICRMPGCNDVKVSMPTPNILNCSMSMVFWIRWTSAALSVGRGPLGRSQIGEITGNMPALHSMSVATGGNVQGIFEVAKSNGKC